LALVLNTIVMSEWCKEVNSGLGLVNDVCKLKKVCLRSELFRLVYCSSTVIIISLFFATVFRGALVFNGDLHQWDVAKVTNMGGSKSISYNLPMRCNAFETAAGFGFEISSFVLLMRFHKIFLWDFKEFFCEAALIRFFMSFHAFSCIPILWDVLVFGFGMSRDFHIKCHSFWAFKDFMMSSYEISWCWTVVRLPVRLHTFRILCDFIMTLFCVLLDGCRFFCFVMRFHAFCGILCCNIRVARWGCVKVCLRVSSGEGCDGMCWEWDYDLMRFPDEILCFFGDHYEISLWDYFVSAAAFSHEICAGDLLKDAGDWVYTIDLHGFVCTGWI
jgi:hypothetical protein